MATPSPLEIKSTGVIDHSVALEMWDDGYDLRYYLETNWPRIGPQLTGKLHLYCGDMDSFYLNLAVYLLEDFLKGTTDPFYAGSFEYGRPMKGHGWMPIVDSKTWLGAAFYAVLVGLVAWLAGRAVRLAVQRYLERQPGNEDQTAVRFLAQLARVGVWIFALFPTPTSFRR